MCAADENARELLNYEFPKWKDKHWHPRTTSEGDKAIGRMVSVPPNDPERFYLRIQLCNVREPASFEELRTVDGTVCETFQEAAQARGLLEDDEEWRE
ncbi:hypothetical protein PI125_g8409 [Phytophthora idaei]|nr:hypothetical protein PI125_g8409 [Phytophthora idaei]